MNSTRDSTIDNELLATNASDTNEPATAAAVLVQSRFDFHLAIQRLRPGALFAGLVAPAPVPAPDSATEPEAASETLPQLGNTPQADDDLPPPLRSDSDSDSDSDASDSSESDAQSDAGSLPSLQTVSDSSDDGEDIYDSDSDAEEWDENEEHPVSDGDWNEREAGELVDDFRRGLEVISSAVQGTTFSSGDEVGEWDYDDEDYVGEEIAFQGGEATMRSIDLLEWLMSPQRLAADNDPERAETLIAGLEVVSDELVGRYEKLRGGEGDAAEGCAICRDDYLIHYECNHADFWKFSERDLTTAHFAMLPFHPSPYQILAFPCPGRHLFHHSCLAPWLARKTTCPSCRFDIDPHSLTLHRTGTMSLYARGMGKWNPPAVSGLEEWLTEEERYKEEGHRPERAHTSRPEPPRQEHSGSMATHANDGPRPFRMFTTRVHASSPGRSTSQSLLARSNHSSQPWVVSGPPGARRTSTLPRRPRGDALQAGTAVPARNVHAPTEDFASLMHRLSRSASPGRFPHSRQAASPPHPIFPALMPDPDGASDDELPALVE